ncbi:hypothetical protein QFC20_002608 [Naganishia adeliensis]|uniref:Uncharacterized protein n=1 Tax=Naganishia adeliensis TaxID=92952 RepID=A0ACC2WL81_9TREE|nr:hypothetical protein QFC20_002608 [Naganishia adeliensis]
MFALKRALRKATQQRIATLSRAEVERQSRQILEHLRNEGILDGKRAIGCYLSMQDGEVGTEGIVEELLRNGLVDQDVGRNRSGRLVKRERIKEMQRRENTEESFGAAGVVVGTSMMRGYYPAACRRIQELQQRDPSNSSTS